MSALIETSTTTLLVNDLWLAVQDKVSTRAFLHQRTVLSVTQASCVFCSSDLEISEHLFIHCNFSRSVWIKVLDW